MDPAIKAAKAVLIQILDDLQNIGVLQKKNLVDIEDLVHMPEKQVIEDTTDKEIFETVQKLRSGKQDREKNGSDNDEEDKLKLTRKETLQATSTLCKYITDLDNPFACKIVGILSQFDHETWQEEAIVMVDTLITDYLVRT
ncbi:hypothetical protein FB451DRAFT_1059227 [Mycena latifolia]|nr:hypothetical protein FB451DRAFT_1059227 [Mycena latifolia]